MAGPSLEDTDNLLALRMLNEFAYCPRLFHLMHVQDRWADNAFTVEGRNVHYRTDQLDHVLPDPDAPHQKGPAEDTDNSEGDEPPTITRSVVVGSGSLGQAVNCRQDQVIILDLGPADSPMDARLECIGMAYSPPARVTVI